MKKNISHHHKPIKVIAHRGNSAQCPENTRISFLEAIQLKVDFLEGDIQFSRDGVPIVIHDATFYRITQSGSEHPVNALDLKEIQNIDAGSWFDIGFADERILTLEEFLCLPRGNTGIMLDVKEETFTDKEMAKIIRNILFSVGEKRLGHGPILIGSLNSHLLLNLETFLPGQTFIPIVKSTDELDGFQEINSQYYALKHTIVTSQLVDKLHDQGHQVWAWTVDDKNLAKKLIDKGIDGIITNHPKKMLNLTTTRYAE